MPTNSWRFPLTRYSPRLSVNPSSQALRSNKASTTRTSPSIKSNLGDGLTGLMVLSMKTDIFKTIHPDAFVIPTNLGPAPDPIVIAAASTSTKIADIYKAYALESAIYAEYVTARRISVKLALDSMLELYYKSVKNAYTLSRAMT